MAVHRGLIGIPFISGEDAGVLGVLGNEVADGFPLVGADVLRHLQQGVAHRLVVALLGAYDSGDRQHSFNSPFDFAMSTASLRNANRGQRSKRSPWRQRRSRRSLP